MKKNLRTIGIASTILVGALALSACSTGTTGTSSDSLAKSDSVSAEANLIANYESEFGAIDAGTETALVDLGYTVCESLDLGMDFDTILSSAYGTGMGGYEAGYIVGASVTDLCPEYTDYMDQYLAANGF